MHYKATLFRYVIIGVFIFLSFSLLSSEEDISADANSVPVTPDALLEVSALLSVFYNISGKYTLTGQHNYPNTASRNSRFAYEYSGEMPAIYSTDWGHAKDGNSDSYLARPDIVAEAIRQHTQGSLVMICWHAVPPTADEPVTFRALPGADPNNLASVQGQLLDEQFRDVLTPGTELHKKWTGQVDAVAKFLKQLEEARVPVLWRPYHEMNGDWFWWGGRTGEYSSAALYRQLFDRYVHHHKLKNLIWIWSVDRPHEEALAYDKYFPGIEYMDLLSLDVYGNDFKQDYYDQLVAIGQGKPVALGEVGNPPALEILDKQPGWTFYCTWAQMVRNTTRKQYALLTNDPRIANRDDDIYAEIMNKYRSVCQLPALPLPVEKKPVNFSGFWRLNEERSKFDRFGAAFQPVKIRVEQSKKDIQLEKTRVLEYTDDEVEEVLFTLDGEETETTFWQWPRFTAVEQPEDGQSLVFRSRINVKMGEQESEVLASETWSLENRGSVLRIIIEATSPWGKNEASLVYDKW